MTTEIGYDVLHYIRIDFVISNHIMQSSTMNKSFKCCSYEGLLGEAKSYYEQNIHHTVRFEELEDSHGYLYDDVIGYTKPIRVYLIFENIEDEMAFRMAQCENM